MNWRTRILPMRYRACKVNYVISVNLILFTVIFIENVLPIKRVYYPLYKVFLCILLKITLDRYMLLSIISFTVYWSYNNDKKQNKNPQGKHHTQFAAPEGYRSIISGSRVFRCKRFVSNEIRNAKKGFVRWVVHFKGCKIIWTFSTIFLQSSYKLSGKRVNWAIALQKRAAKTAQIFQRYNVLYQIISYQRSRDKIAYYSQKIARQIRCYSALPKHRKSFETTGKKTLTSPSTALPVTALERYEAIRILVIKGEHSFPSSYWAFVNQGMLAWAKKIEQASQGSVISQPKLNNNPIIHILTDMILYVQQETHHAC